MTRFFIFLIAAPIVVVSTMASTGQLTLADFQVRMAPQYWPSSTPKDQGTTIPPQVDLSISKSASSDPAPLGVPLTYTITIANNGNADAPAVIVADALPQNVDFGSATASQGSCNGMFIVVCSLGVITDGLTATATIVVTPTHGLSLANVAFVTSFGTSDPNPVNNKVVKITSISPASVIYLPLIMKKAQAM